MSVINNKEALERLDQLIRLKATWTPAELAKRFNTTERTIFRIINKLKEIGCPVYYNKERGSYCYEFDGRLVFRFELKKIDNYSII